jgi:DNA-binding Xre family transcriptional regulator
MEILSAAIAEVAQARLKRIEKAIRLRILLKICF